MLLPAIDNKSVASFILAADDHPEETIMKIAIGADCDGYALYRPIREYLLGGGHDIVEFGVTREIAEGETSAPYYRTAHEIARQVAAGVFQTGVLVCGTGMGMAIIANKHPGVYAAVCENPHAAENARSVNNANILTLGAMVTTAAVARRIIDAWLQTPFTHGWGAEDRQWLENSMTEIAALEQSLFRDHD